MEKISLQLLSKEEQDRIHTASLEILEPNLESVFLDLTGRRLRE